MNNTLDIAPITKAKQPRTTMMNGKEIVWQGSKWIRAERRLAIYIRDNFECQYCGIHLKNAKKAGVSLDHLTPRSQGGGNESTNLITVCSRCNSSRGDRDWRDYAPQGAQDRIEAQIKLPVNVELAKEIIANRGGESEEVR